MQGLSYEEATANFWVLDAEGLVTVKREKQLSESVEPLPGRPRQTRKARVSQTLSRGYVLADSATFAGQGCLGMSNMVPDSCAEGLSGESRHPSVKAGPPVPAQV